MSLSSCLDPYWSPSSCPCWSSSSHWTRALHRLQGQYDFPCAADPLAVRLMTFAVTPVALQGLERDAPHQLWLRRRKSILMHKHTHTHEHAHIHTKVMAYLRRGKHIFMCMGAIRTSVALWMHFVCAHSLPSRLRVGPLPLWCWVLGQWSVVRGPRSVVRGHG